MDSIEVLNLKKENINLQLGYLDLQEELLKTKFELMSFQREKLLGFAMQVDKEIESLGEQT